MSAALTEAGDRARTGDPNLGKVVLYQLSYTRVASVREETIQQIIFSCQSQKRKGRGARI